MTSLLRITPSAVSEHISELIGCPISTSFATSCVYLEPRLLPSTGITQLRQYYEPLRHPISPEPSLTSFQLVIPDHAMGLPVLRAFSLCTCCHHYPGTATGGTALLIHFSRISLPRKGYRVGLCIVLFEACSVFTHITACTLAQVTVSRDPHFQRLQPFRYLHSCSSCFRLELSPGGIHTHWKTPPYHGAHPKPPFECEDPSAGADQKRTVRMFGFRG
jgi:hypothetical protein